MALPSASHRRSVLIGNLNPNRVTTTPDPATESPDDEPTDVLIEFDVHYSADPTVTYQRIQALWAEVVDHARPALQRVSPKLCQAVLTHSEMLRLVAADQSSAAAGRRLRPAIFRIWPDYVLTPQIDRSAITVKADAAWRSYQAGGRGIVWAVIDSGIQADHQHFAGLQIGALAAGGTKGDHPTDELHADFTTLVQPSKLSATPADPDPLHDALGHGSHVAGIISGQSPADGTPRAAAKVVATSDEPVDGAGYVARTRTGLLAGMAPQCELVSLKVLRPDTTGAWVTSFSAVIAALEHVRQVNVSRSTMRIHGVNLSLGCEWDPAHYAAGQSPLCQAINELVASGVVVVVSSGNGGATQAVDSARQQMSLMGTITEPGHAADCITVGSTHRDAPMTFGVSWTSGKGPTLDGRRKPDLVAPGEWITSVAVGQVATRAGLSADEIAGRCTYAEQSGTSMAAPHVSGVIAGFLANRTEYIGRPQDVKDMVCASATDLHREPYAQGHGLIDAMRLLSNS